MTQNTFLSLTSLAQELEQNREHLELQDAIGRAWRAQGCISDLHQARDCWTVLDQRKRNPHLPDTPESLTVERALQITSVSLYARATATERKGRERGSINLDKKHLTDAEWTDHTALIKIRDQALAHVHSSTSSDPDVWHHHLLFMQEVTKDGWLIGSAARQTGLHLATQERMGRMLPVADRLLKAHFEKRTDAVIEKLSAAKLSRDRLSRHEFDPTFAFGAGGISLVADARPGSSNSAWVIGAG